MDFKINIDDESQHGTIQSVLQAQLQEANLTTNLMKTLISTMSLILIR